MYKFKTFTLSAHRLTETAFMEEAEWHKVNLNNESVSEYLHK